MDFGNRTNLLFSLCQGIYYGSLGICSISLQDLTVNRTLDLPSYGSFSDIPKLLESTGREGNIECYEWQYQIMTIRELSKSGFRSLDDTHRFKPRTLVCLLSRHLVTVHSGTKKGVQYRLASSGHKGLVIHRYLPFLDGPAWSRFFPSLLYSHICPIISIPYHSIAAVITLSVTYCIEFSQQFKNNEVLCRCVRHHNVQCVIFCSACIFHEKRNL